MQKTLNKARKALFSEKNPRDAIEILRPLMQSNQYSSLTKLARRPFAELAALSHELICEYDLACGYFISIDDYYQSGYCHMLKGNLDKAFDYWKELLKIRSNHWCTTLAGLITGYLNCMPTFLQIRNHMEADIVHLIEANQDIMAFNIVKNSKLLSEINLEAYKFSGRALFNAGKIEESFPLLILGQKALPCDPEIYYHLGQYYQAVGKEKNACLMLKQCLLISPFYTPAIWLLENIQEQA